MRLEIDKVHNYIQQNEDLKRYYRWYLEHCISLSVPYHNLSHTLGMMLHVINIFENSNSREHDYGFTLSQQDLYILLTSALFHDYNHSAGQHKDDINIENAKLGLDACIRSVLPPDETTDKLIEICCDTIDGTEFPYRIPDEQLNLYQRILRECDILVSFYDDYFTHNVIGLYTEMRPGCSLLDFVSKQMEFMMNSFKMFKLKYSLELLNTESEKFLEFMKNIYQIL